MIGHSVVVESVADACWVVTLDRKKKSAAVEGISQIYWHRQSLHIMYSLQFKFDVVQKEYAKKT